MRLSTVAGVLALGILFMATHTHAGVDVAAPTEGKAVFGGLYLSNSMSKVDTPNPLTGNMNCPEGYAGHQVVGQDWIDVFEGYCDFVGLEATLCLLKGAQPDPGTFGGLYQPDSSIHTFDSMDPDQKLYEEKKSGFLNPVTGSHKCPAGSTALPGPSAVGPTRPVLCSAVPKPEDGNKDLVGGSYLTLPWNQKEVWKSFLAANPITGDNSCPSGYTPKDYNLGLYSNLLHDFPWGCQAGGDAVNLTWTLCYANELLPSSLQLRGMSQV